jgi:alpha-L-fucosidase
MKVQNICNLCLALLAVLFSYVARATEPPVPYGPVPTSAQLFRQTNEFYGFLHFTVNTFTDREWGDGDEDEKVFYPTNFDADQIVRTAKLAGMKCLILTCKHHDGFCLWPSADTEHSVKNSRWENGKGDVVKEISGACRKYGLKFGVYLSPWDRNNANYGKPEYITNYRNELRELLTDYGPIYEVWFDGANGGSGYYGGARETRHIDNKTYYDWPHTWQMVRELQPNAVMFSDGGPDIRWVGNEDGIAGDPCWETLNAGELGPGYGPNGRDYCILLNSGDRHGTNWLPAECDVSIRPGWFYHPREDGHVKTPRKLVDIYYESVGRGASLLLNIPPDRTGQIHSNDVASLRRFRHILDETFAHDFACKARVTASNVRGNDERFSPKNVLDGNPNTYWSTDDAVTNAELVLDLLGPTTFNVVRLGEYLALGQRVDTYALDQWQDGQWVEFAKGMSIGHCRLVRGRPVLTSKVRLRLTGPVCPAISEVGLFAEPVLDDETNESTVAPERIEANLALHKRATSDSDEDGHEAANGNDGDDDTRWCADDGGTNHWWQVDLGRNYNLTDSQVEWEMGEAGTIYKYKIEVSTDSAKWTLAADKGNNTSIDKTQFDKIPAIGRYVRVTVLSVSNGQWASFYEFIVHGSPDNDQNKSQRNK